MYVPLGLIVLLCFYLVSLPYEQTVLLRPGVGDVDDGGPDCLSTQLLHLKIAHQ